MHTTTKKPIEIGTIGAGITKTVCISLASLVFSRTHGGGGNGGGHALPSAGSGWRGGGGQQAATVPEAAGDGLRQRPPLRRIRREGRREAAAPSPRPDSAGRHRHLPPPSATTARHPPALPPAATARRHRPPLPSCWSAVAWVCVVAPLSPPPQPPLPPAPARPPASADAFDCGIHPAYSGMAVLPYFDEIDPSTIDVLLITHFHLDHAASLPYFLEKPPAARRHARSRRGVDESSLGGAGSAASPHLATVAASDRAGEGMAPRPCRTEEGDAMKKKCLATVGFVAGELQQRRGEREGVEARAARVFSPPSPARMRTTRGITQGGYLLLSKLLSG
uniref:Metallo-beta-lactamase domain-containing protein n=1 Tax=Oryza meridionalis TaxID=40149 RepID=A0A0E0EXE4_9ORYZ